MELTLRDYLQIFLRRWWVVALAAILCTGLAFVWTARLTPQYRSSASILINQANASDLFDPVGTGNSLSYAERAAATEARFLVSGLVSNEVAERLGFEASVSVSEDSFADVLTVTATSPDAAEAQQIAQVYADTYVEVREQRFASERTSIANQLAERLAEIDLQIAAATGVDVVRLDALRNDVAQSLDLLELTAGLAEDSGTIVIDEAFLPDAPFTPQTNRNVALGLILGLMTGAGLVLLLEALDQSVKSRDVLEGLTPGAPNLALIPSLGKSLQRSDTLISQSDPNGESAEAFRTLRAALQYVAVDDNARVIQVASAHSAAGKTTVAANLAITLAQAGQRVIVVDADLRRPRLHQLFGFEQTPGLTSAIIGVAPLTSCVQSLDDDGSTPLVLTSGPIPPGPAELLGSSAAERIINEIRDLADYVIIDTAPVLPVADTSVLSTYVDASILVADASKTKRGEIALAFERLDQAGAPVIGTVLNRVKRRRGLMGYGYGYGYGYGGYQADGAGKSGLVGWFSRGADDSKIERLHGSDVPRLTAASRKTSVTAEPTPIAPATQTATNGSVSPKTKPADTEPANTKPARSKTADIKPASSKTATAQDVVPQEATAERLDEWIATKRSNASGSKRKRNDNSTVDSTPNGDGESPKRAVSFSDAVALDTAIPHFMEDKQPKRQPKNTGTSSKSKADKVADDKAWPDDVKFVD